MLFREAWARYNTVKNTVNNRMKGNPMTLQITPHWWEQATAEEDTMEIAAGRPDAGFAYVTAGAVSVIAVCETTEPTERPGETPPASSFARMPARDASVVATR